MVYNLWTLQATETCCTSLEVYFCNKHLYFLYQSSMSFRLVISQKCVCQIFSNQQSHVYWPKHGISLECLKFESQYPLSQQKWIINTIKTFVICHSTVYIPFLMKSLKKKLINDQFFKVGSFFSWQSLLCWFWCVDFK